LRLLVADAHRLTLLAIAALLEDVEEIQLVASTTQGTAVLPLVNEHRPEVVLLNASLPDFDGLLVLERLRKHFPAVRVVIFDEDARLLEQARQGGACAYISKHIEPAQLAPALHQAAASEQFLSLGFPAQSEPRPPRGLTNRELAILKAVAAGQTNKQIAAALFVTEQTVKFHLTNIYRKLDLRSRTDAARFAYHHGLAESSYLIPDVA
jgi:DNA-binding NarL/FixJ family response regulator